MVGAREDRESSMLIGERTVNLDRQGLVTGSP
jgi:hypothetical protein